MSEELRKTLDSNANFVKTNLELDSEYELDSEFINLAIESMYHINPMLAIANRLNICDSETGAEGSVEMLAIVAYIIGYKRALETQKLKNILKE